MLNRKRLAISLVLALLAPFTPRPEIEFFIPLGVVMGLIVYQNEEGTGLLIGVMLVYWTVISAVIYFTLTGISRYRKRKGR